MISDSEKRDIFQAAKGVMLEWYGEHLADQGACLYWAQTTMRELALRGYTPLLQAGTMLWRIVPPSQDDGIRPTHFGYEWTPDEPFSQKALAAGLLPELHIWVAVRETQELVDFSTAYLPRIAKERYGFEWNTELPPEYIFGRPPEDAFYRPLLPAIKFVWGFIAQKLATPEQREKILQCI